MEEKVLIVDDDPDFLEALADRMRANGMNVTTSMSAKQAIEMTATQAFDAVVLDLIMPEMDGLETLEALKKTRPDLQVILLTGHATVTKGIEAMKLGAMDFIEKPADLKTITEKIKKAHARRMIITEKRTQEKIQKIIQEKGW
ncbi:MAG: response regulator [Proteobacteria bacterium]|nr:response regulator [Pseudomonadota bacterium]